MKGSYGFLQRLFTLGILGIDLWPGRRQEHQLVIPERMSSLFDMRRHRQFVQKQVAHDIGNAPVEQDGPLHQLRFTVGTHIPAEHEFCKGGRVLPGQGCATNGQLILDDGAAGFGHACKTVVAERL